ncbi:hypothetical protein PPIS_a3270 [Pseudoalteromonas piscicida]|uniref:Uncharacterized protein n=1 Tax=Pseudoalteromonas piscicida TaxID=43662 RepID=A0ABM6NGV0_PSEO7|nr:hypothetical protein PPIS_a3270 [Pseudoalteromonas piscicida]
MVNRHFRWEFQHELKTILVKMSNKISLDRDGKNATKID